MAESATQVRVWVTNPARAGLLGWLLRYYVFAAACVIVTAVYVGHRTYRSYAAELPDLGQVEQYDTIAPGVTRIYAADGSVLAELAREHRSYAAIDAVPEHLIHAFLAAEDRRFFGHNGLDWRGLGRAVLANLRSGTVVQGGSTITQQVAKGFLSDERTLDRKLREAILSVRIESRLGKRRILEIYLNKIFLGHGAYGVAAAASRYFGKDLDELTLAESAMIAGLARAPSRYSPVTSPERALARRRVVLHDMMEAGYITSEQKEAASAEPLRLVTPTDVFRLRAPFYAEHVRREVGEAHRCAGEPGAVVDQIVDIIEMLVRGLHRLAQRAGIGGLAVDDALLHPLEEQRPGNLEIEILVEPGDEAADLGAIGGGAVDHRCALDRFLKVFADRPAVAQGQPALRVVQHRHPARRVEVEKFVARFPRVFTPQLVADALLGHQQTQLAAEGAQGELEELPHGSRPCTSASLPSTRPALGRWRFQVENYRA